MKKLLLVLPALLFAACGDNLHPDVDQAVGGAGDGTSPVPDTPGDNDLVAFFLSRPNDCADHSVFLEGHYGYQDQPFAEGLTCTYQFADGTTVDGCGVVHSFPSPENVIFTVTDPATGASKSYQEVVVGPETFTVWLDVNGFNFGNNQLAIGWYVHTRYGNVEDVGRTYIDISPIENLIIPTPDADIFANRFGPIGVTQPGTYSVTARGWIDFGGEGGCSGEVTTTVEVPACSSDPHSP